MAVNRLSNARIQYDDGNGALASNYRLFFYAAGSSTKQNTYNSSAGSVANSNPIVLNALGEPGVEIWLTAGQSYKLGIAIPGTDDPPASFVWTEDVISGVNDTTSAVDEWKASQLTPTFVSATSFTLAGDQTTEFHVSRRLKSTTSGGTVYSKITASSFAAGTTTLTVANDSGVLDAGLSAVSYGIIRAANPSVSPDAIARKGTAVASAATTDIWSITGDFVHITGVVAITSLGTAPYAGAQRVVVFDGALTLTHNATTLQLPGGANITTAAGDRAVVRADTTANMIVVDYVKASGQPNVTGSTLTGGWSAGTQCVQNPVAASTVTTQAHGLSRKPDFVLIWLECLTAELGYSIGDRTMVGQGAVSNFSTPSWDATNVKILTNATTPAINRKDTGVAANITLADWKVVAQPLLFSTTF